MLLTARDVIDRLVDFAGDSPTSAAMRAARRAVPDALREVGSAHSWSYLTRQGRLVTSAPYQAGAITYDHTGGASERLVTLSGGTFPDWASDGLLAISNIGYEVERRMDSTSLVLYSTGNPGADLSATSYALYRDGYPLPRGTRKLDVVQAETYGELVPVKLADMNYLNRRYISPGVPRHWAVTGSPDYLGLVSLFLAPFPDRAYQIDYVCVTHPRPLRVLDQTGGTVSVSQGSQSVTGSGTAFTQDMVGSIIRFSSTQADLPTDASGQNPAVMEHSVLEVVSATSLTLDQPAAQSVSGVAWIVSDPVDVDDVMANAFLRCAEKHFAVARRLDWAPAAETIYRRELLEACGADSRAMTRSGPAAAWRPRMRDMPVGPDITG